MSIKQPHLPKVEQDTLVASQMVSYSINSALRLTRGSWSKIAHYIGNKVRFGTHTHKAPSQQQQNNGATQFRRPLRKHDREVKNTNRTKTDINLEAGC